MRLVARYTFTGIENFRDFGGVACAGGHLPAGRLFRSAHLGGAQENDLKVLDSLGIATIIDLRRPSERARHPTPGVLNGRVVANDDGDRTEAPHLAFLRQGDTSDAAVEAFLLNYYRGAPFDPRNKALFTRAFAALDKGPMLIHCAAGKDRTGILAALIQFAAGVHPDDVTADFLESNDAMMTDANIARAGAQATQLLGHRPSDTVIRAMLGVEIRHLQAALQSIEGEAGSLGTYLRQIDPRRAG